MCGRYALYCNLPRLAQVLDVLNRIDWEARYNLAPGQRVPVVRGGADGRREYALLRWGLIPGWSREPRSAYSLINARAETLSGKPVFRDAFRRRRCLIPASGFYEWQRLAGRKQPFYITREELDRPLLLAGLWESWHGGEREPIESCAIVTTAANDLMRPIHGRMPAILTPESAQVWLDSDSGKGEALQGLLASYPGSDLVAIPVSSYVNNARNEGSACIAPLETEPGTEHGRP